MSPHLYLPAAIWAKFKIANDRFSAIFARPGPFLLLPCETRAKFMEGLLASLTHDKRLSFFNS
jgi:hypothetical protein